MKTTKTKIALYITSEHKDEYFRPICYPVIIGPDAYERAHAAEYGQGLPRPEAIRNVSERQYFELGKLYLENFRVHALGADRDVHPAGLFAFEYGYHTPHFVDASTADRMARTLKTIGARMSRIRDTFGDPADFPSYVARVAECLGAESFVTPYDETETTWNYNDTRHRYLTRADGVYAVARMIARWQEKLRPAPARPAAQLTDGGVQ